MKMPEYLRHAASYCMKVAKVIWMKDAWEYLNGIRAAQIISSVVVNIIDAGAKLLGPAAFAKAITMVALDESQDEVWGLSLNATELIYIAIALNGLQLITPDIRKLVLYGAGEKILEGISYRLAKKTLQLSSQEHEKKKHELLSLWAGANNEALNYIPTVTNGIHPVLINLIVGSSLCGYYFGGEVAGISFAYILFSGLILNNVLSYLTGLPESTRQTHEAFSNLFYGIQETMQNYETVKLFNRENFEITNISQRVHNYISIKNKNMLKETLWATQAGLSLITQFLVAWHIARNGFKTYEIDKTIFLFNYINNVSASVSSINHPIRFALVITDYFEKKLKPFLYSKEEDLAEFDIENQETLPILNLRGCLQTQWLDRTRPLSIEFQGVSFSYGTRMVLNNISFHIPGGSNAAIVGKTNSGKSTLFKLLTKLISPNAGVIRINGIDIKDIPTEELRRAIGIVKQRVDLFETDSLEYNLLYGCLDDTRLHELRKHSPYLPDKKAKLELEESEKRVLEEVTSQSRLTHLRPKLINACSHGTLSGGEEQRIGLARILARQAFFKKQSAIFLYDEPTSQLDALTEADVLSSIEAVTKGNTTLMAAHRLSTVKNFSQILVIEEGKIAEKGSHDELMKQKGYYATMYTRQSMQR